MMRQSAVRTSVVGAVVAKLEAHGLPERASPAPRGFGREEVALDDDHGRNPAGIPNTSRIAWLGRLRGSARLTSSEAEDERQGLVDGAELIYFEPFG
jgi:hypothetical protein